MGLLKLAEKWYGANIQCIVLRGVTHTDGSRSHPCYVVDNIVKLLLLERKIWIVGILWWLHAMLIFNWQHIPRPSLINCMIHLQFKPIAMT